MKTSINELIDLHPEFKEVYDSYNLMIQKIDYAKYLILYVCGGMYVDMDVLCLKSVMPLISIDKELIVSLSPYRLIDRILISLAGHNPIRKLINNGIIAAIPQESHLKMVLEYCKKYRKSIWKNVSKPVYIFRTTGPIIFTKAINHQGINDNVELLDHTLFEACNCFSVNRGCQPPPNAYGSHVYELSWMGKTSKRIMNWYLSK